MLSQLEALALAACVTPRGRRPDRDEYDRLLADPLLCDGRVALWDDPYEHHFTELFDFDGGPYLVFPGATTGGTSVLSSLVGGLRRSEGSLPSRFTQDAHRLIRGVLKLSQALISRAGLPRLTTPTGPHWLSDGTVHPTLPDATVLAHLRRAATFSRTQLATLLGTADARELLLNLGVRSSNVSPDALAGAENPLLLRPLVITGEEVIVTCPHTLLAAVVRRVLRLAQEQGASEALSALIQQTNVQRAELALHRLDASPLDIPLEPSPLPGAFRAIYLLDTELLLQVIVLTEPVAAVDPRQYLGVWEFEVPELHPTLPADLPRHEVLTLLVVCSHGDAYRLTLSPDTRRSTLMLDIDDLETFASSHPQEPLTLYRLHQSQLALQDQLNVTYTAPIDLMEVCCEADLRRSFPFVQGQPLLLGSAPSSEWRRGVKAARDQHLTPWIDHETLVPIERAWDTSPGVYVPVVSPWSRGAMVVERGQQTIWILDATGHSQLYTAEQEHTVVTSGLVAQVVDALPVWVEQLLPELPTFQQATVAVVIHPSIDAQRSDFALDIDRREGVVHLALGGAFSSQLSSPDNRAERELLAMTYLGLSELATGQRAPIEEVRAMVDRLAPLGDQRLIFSIQPALNAELDPRNLTRPRLVQVSEWHAKQVLIGRSLAAELGWAPGPLTDLTRGVMEKANALLFTELRQTLADCDGHELLNVLLSLYEALRQEVAWKLHTGISRQLTHGQHAQQVEGRHHSTSTALRFLIELVVAEPPTGTRPASLRLIDDLVASGVVIIEYGMAGDALKHALGTVEGEYGLDGSFQVQAREYSEAANAQSASFLARSMQMANASRYPHPAQAADLASFELKIDTVDSAFQALYGLTFRDLLGFLNEVQNLGDGLDGLIIRMPLTEFLNRIQARSGWPLDKVNRALALLTMEARADFLVPPAPYLKSDVFPWQFNRELSLGRRPLLLVSGEQGQDLVWGNRVVEGTKRYWAYSLVGDNRLNIPPSPDPARRQAQQLLSGLQETGAADFNHAVAERARAGGCQVKENVRKIGRERLNVDGGDLGDIDVLAIDCVLKRIWVVECKDYTVARTPVELATDLDTLVRGKQRRNGHRERPLFERHQRRTEFVVSHQREVLQMFNEPDDGPWTVHPLVVMSSEPFLLLRNLAQIPLASVDEFERLLTRA